MKTAPSIIATYGRVRIHSRYCGSGVTPRIVLSATLSHVSAKFTSTRDSIPVFVDADTVLIAPSDFPPLIPPLHGELGVRYERTNWFVGPPARIADRQDRLGDFEDPTAG